MKKAIIIALSALALCAGANAQEHRQDHKRPDQAAMIQGRTDHMAEKYGLDETQKSKLLELNKEFFGKMRHGKMDRGKMRRPELSESQKQEIEARKQEMEARKKEMEARKKEMDENRAAYEAGLKSILTEEQFQAYKKDLESHKDRRR
ncbi:MAG: DUF4890 domain-containing protein [Bacteroidales bacterium]|nr:DUF4890 domain-containing protein [Bacteroidales bacterium]